jgi:hypothetical protein
MYAMGPPKNMMTTRFFKLKTSPYLAYYVAIAINVHSKEKSRLNPLNGRVSLSYLFSWINLR